MTTDVLDLADRLWRGEVRTSEYHPVGHLGGLAAITDDVVFLPAFANVTAIRTAEVPVRLPERVWSMNRVPSCTVNSISCISL